MRDRFTTALLISTLLLGSNSTVCRAADDKLTVASKDGKGVSVKNFKLYRTTLTRDTMPGRFILAGGLNPHGSGAPYLIFYTEPIKGFSVLILRKPVAQMRERAERELMEKLGVGKDEMCKLDCYVQVTSDVDKEEIGKNLGFTFCPPPTTK